MPSPTNSPTFPLPAISWGMSGGVPLRARPDLLPARILISLHQGVVRPISVIATTGVRCPVASITPVVIQRENVEYGAGSNPAVEYNAVIQPEGADSGIWRLQLSKQAMGGGNHLLMRGITGFTLALG
jgi:hypothetical protein